METKDNDKQPITILAETNFRNQRRRFGIKKDDRRRHMYLIGKTGMGKSTVLENMIIQDIRNGEGVAVVDPHGDLAETIIQYIPSYRINDVIYFNPADPDYSIAFNVMESVSAEHKHLIASGLIAVFHKLWADSWGPRLEYLLRNSILALLDYPGSTLLGVTRLLVDKNYRYKVVSKIKDPVVKAFWSEEFPKYSNQFQVEAISPIQNKVGQFLSIAMIRNIVGQVKSTIDLRDIMDHKKILIMNLAKGRIGEDASALLGAMMITKLQLAAMSRVDIAEEQRQDFYLYVDEFQNFATESFANILSEARKYRLNIIIAHQYIEQLDEKVRASVFGNVGTIMLFRVGAADAEFLVQEFTPYFKEEDLVNLTKHNTYMKLMIDGVSSNPFSATTLPPLKFEFSQKDNSQKVIAVSRERYSRPKQEIEDKIARWSGMSDESAVKIKTGKAEDAKTSEDADKKKPPRKRKNDEKSYTVKCYECGKTTTVNFVPDGIRPVYCVECFRKIRSGEIVKPDDESGAENSLTLKEAMAKEPMPFKTTRKDNNEKQPKNQTYGTNSSNQDQNSDSNKIEPEQSKPKIIKKLDPGQVIRFD
ncbi:hypothetical protein C4569_00535 [Candidatus Parcubacteria bacterium]|nr:MAG: hypothetical protein C4569_00535 [Candidatus Parcubacteria bacterium]